jgi:hypothetical protein
MFVDDDEEIFNPALASRLLKENALKMEEAAKDVINKRNAYVIAEAELMDTESEAREKRLKEYPVTTAKEMVKNDCIEARKKLTRAEADYKNATDMRQVLEFSNNNLKMRIRLATDELKNLNYTE